jgi:hypothetical protein
MSSNDAISNTFEKYRQECTTLEKLDKPSSSMCKDLDIKIAIMQRYWENAPCHTVSMPPMISVLLGVDVSYNLMRYTSMTPKNVIISDISKGLPIALELDNLKPNWN